MPRRLRGRFNRNGSMITRGYTTMKTLTVRFVTCVFRRTSVGVSRPIRLSQGLYQMGIQIGKMQQDREEGFLGMKIQSVTRKLYNEQLCCQDVRT